MDSRRRGQLRDRPGPAAWRPPREAGAQLTQIEDRGWSTLSPAAARLAVPPRPRRPARVLRPRLAGSDILATRDPDARSDRAFPARLALSQRSSALRSDPLSELSVWTTRWMLWITGPGGTPMSELFRPVPRGILPLIHSPGGRSVDMWMAIRSTFGRKPSARIRNRAHRSRACEPKGQGSAALQTLWRAPAGDSMDFRQEAYGGNPKPGRDQGGGSNGSPRTGPSTPRPAGALQAARGPPGRLRNPRPGAASESTLERRTRPHTDKKPWPDLSRERSQVHRTPRCSEVQGLPGFLLSCHRRVGSCAESGS